MHYSIDEIKQKWLNAADDTVLKAYLEIHLYHHEVSEIIKAEFVKRGLMVEIPSSPNASILNPNWYNPNCDIHGKKFVVCKSCGDKFVPKSFPLVEIVYISILILFLITFSIALYYATRPGGGRYDDSGEKLLSGCWLIISIPVLIVLIIIGMVYFMKSSGGNDPKDVCCNCKSLTIK